MINLPVPVPARYKLFLVSNDDSGSGEYCTGKDIKIYGN
jgi:hypothetical protein